MEAFLKSRGIDTDELNFKQVSEHLYTIIKQSWDYDHALQVQKLCLEHVREHPKDLVFIYCSHPFLYTMGRGLQKQKGGKPNEELVEFGQQDSSILSFPLYQIKRGGGLTFHHPEQWIFYPIINLNRHDWNLNKHFHWLLGMLTDFLNEKYNTTDYQYDLCTAGVWRGAKKVASVGVGVERFVTHHGLALNLTMPQTMLDDLSKLHPCGLSFSSYSSIEEQDWLSFHQQLSDKFNNVLLDYNNDR